MPHRPALRHLGRDPGHPARTAPGREARPQSPAGRGPVRLVRGDAGEAARAQHHGGGDPLCDLVRVTTDARNFCADIEDKADAELVETKEEMDRECRENRAQVAPHSLNVHFSPNSVRTGNLNRAVIVTAANRALCLHRGRRG